MADVKADVKAAAAAVPASNEPVKRKMVQRTVIFRPPYTKKDGTTPNLASADVLGCFGGIPVAVKDFQLRNNGGNIMVFMPSGMYSQNRVGPLGGELPTESDVVAEATTMPPDEAKAFIAKFKAKRAAVQVLTDAIIHAWGECGGKFAVPVVVEMPE